MNRAAQAEREAALDRSERRWASFCRFAEHSAPILPPAPTAEETALKAKQTAWNARRDSIALAASIFFDRPMTHEEYANWRNTL